MALPKQLAKAKKIKNIASRDKVDKAYDKAQGIKQGSAKDKALDKKMGVSKFEYGSKKKGY